MRGTSANRLHQAVLAARGDAPVEDTSEFDMSLAHMLIEARSLETEEARCPDRARRRAHALFERMPDGIWETVARLVFDSWSQLAPAARSLGTERLMVYESGVGSLDLQLSREDDGDGTVLAIAVQGGGDELQAEVELDGGEAELLTLDEHGTGSLTVPQGFSSHGPEQVVVVVRDADGELLRTPAVPLR